MAFFIDAQRNAQLLAELRDALTELSVNLKDLQAVADLKAGGPISVLARQELDKAFATPRLSSNLIVDEKKK